MSFQINVDTSKMEKEIREAVALRIETSKAELLNATLGPLFDGPRWRNNQKGGVMYQLMREKAEAIALEEVGKICDKVIEQQFNEMFVKLFNEHLPKAIDRAARKAAHIAAIRAAKVQAGLIK